MPDTNGDYSSDSELVNSHKHAYVVDDGRDYFNRFRTEVPNLIDDLDLDPIEFRLYFRYRRRAGDLGYCNEGSRSLAASLRTSQSKVIRAKKELERRGLITITPGNRNEPDTTHLVNIWQENTEHFSEGESLQKHPESLEKQGESLQKRKNVVVNNPPIVPPSDVQEFVQECVQILVQETPVWDVNPQLTAKMIAEFARDFPEIDPVEVCKRFRVWTIGLGGLSPRAKPLSSLRKFFGSVNEGDDRPLKERPRRLKTAASPEPVIEAIQNYTSHSGKTDLRKYAALARDKWNFTLEEDPPWQILKELGGNEEERRHRLSRLKMVAAQAMKPQEEAVAN